MTDKNYSCDEFKKEYPYREYLFDKDEFRCNLREPEEWPICEFKDGCNKCPSYLEDSKIKKQHYMERAFPYFAD